MGFERRLLHYNSNLSLLLGDLSDWAVEGCWFEVNRLGGCGSGEVVLQSRFTERQIVQTGDWIAFETEAGHRWYLGRVEQRTSLSPAKVTLRLEGMGIELGEVFPGGFGRGLGDGVPPHRYARTDLFYDDPDYSDETVNSVNEPDEVVRLLLQQYVVPTTHIQYLASLVESGGSPGNFTSVKFRGEESVRTILKELALRAKHASWGVDANGQFFFLQKRTNLQRTYREGVDLLKLEESCDGDLLINRVLLTGDYVYFREMSTGGTVSGFYRWRGNYIQSASREKYGERRFKMWVPWIRTHEDSRQFIRELFRVYSRPVSRYLIRVRGDEWLPLPWAGTIRIESQSGELLALGCPETIRIEFDHTPVLSMTIGPEDPLTHWPEPPHDERWEIQSVQVNAGYPSDDLTIDSDERVTEGGSSTDETSYQFSSSSESSESDSGASSGSLSGSLSETGEIESTSISDSIGSDSFDGSTSDLLSSGNSQVSEEPTSEVNSDSTESDQGSDTGFSFTGESTSMSLTESDPSTESSLPDSTNSDGDTSGSESGEGSSGGFSESGSDNPSEEPSSQSGGESSFSLESSGNGSEGSGSSGEGSGATSSENYSSSEEISSSGSSESGTSDGDIVVPCCNNPIPETLHASFSAYGGAMEWDGLTSELTWNPSLQLWSGGIVVVHPGFPQVFYTVTLRCVPESMQWRLGVSGGGCNDFKLISAGGNCQPLTLNFTGLRGCGGVLGYDVSITE